MIRIVKIRPVICRSQQRNTKILITEPLIINHIITADRVIIIGEQQRMYVRLQQLLFLQRQCGPEQQFYHLVVI